MLTLALGFALLCATGLVLGRRSCDGRLAEVLIAAWVYAYAEAVVLVLLLGELGLLRRSWLLVTLASCLLVVLATCRRVPPATVTWARVGASAREAVRDPIVAGFVGLAVIAIGYAFALGVGTPPNDVDSLVYHLPRTVLWLQQGHVGTIAGTSDERLDFAPPNGEIGLLVTILLSGGDRWIAIVQFLALLTLGAAVFGLARRIGLEPRAALYSGLGFVCLPIVLLQAGTALNDLVVASFLASAVLFALVPERGVVVSGLALALAAGVKPTTFAVLPAMVVAIAAHVPRARWLRVGLSWAVAISVGSFWYYVNLAETGRFDGGLARIFEQVPDRAPAAVALRFYQLTANLLETPATAGRGRWIYVLAGAGLAVGGLALAARRERRSGTWLVVVGVVVAVIPVALFRARDSFASVARWSLDRVGDHQLADTVSGPLLQGYPTPMLATFGIAGVLLVAASIPLAAASARRQAIHRGWIALAAAPLIVLLVFALVFTFDEMRARFLIAPVGLAATLWGLVLRRRTLAYGISVLLAASTVASLAFAAWKPSGVALLFGHSGSATGVGSVWTASRWRLQGTGRALDWDANRYVADNVPGDASIGLVMGRDHALYAFFHGRHRPVVLVPEGGEPPHDVPWLVVSDDRRNEVSDLVHQGWRVVLRTDQGWTVMRRDA